MPLVAAPKTVAPNIGTATYKATGATVKRSVAARAADELNVLDFPSIQACLDAAFTTSGTPHGSANAHLNKPVFFPAGNYTVPATLTLNKIVGGLIRGAGAKCTLINYGGPPSSGGALAPIFRTNGCRNLRMQGFALHNSGTDSVCVDLDWDNTTGGAGLGGNHFSDFLMDASDYGIVVAKGTYGGDNNIFEAMTGSNIVTAMIDIRGANAVANLTIAGGAADSGRMCRINQGSMTIVGPSLANNGYDVEVGSTLPCAVVGGRTEGHFLKVTNANSLVSVRGFTVLTGANGLRDMVNFTANAKVTFDGCHSDNGKIVGVAGGQLYVRCCVFQSTYRTGWAGTPVQELL